MEKLILPCAENHSSRGPTLLLEFLSNSCRRGMQASNSCRRGRQRFCRRGNSACNSCRRGMQACSHQPKDLAHKCLCGTHANTVLDSSVPVPKTDSFPKQWTLIRKATDLCLHHPPPPLLHNSLYTLQSLRHGNSLGSLKTENTVYRGGNKQQSISRL